MDCNRPRSLRRVSQLMALSGGGQGVEFTSAFRGAAEVHGRMASAAFDANDPKATCALLIISHNH